MKRIILYVLILLLVVALPVERTDVGKLRPVQAVAVYLQDESVVIETDTGDRGVGTGVKAALENLKATTPAVIYLDTADYLIISEGAEQAAQELRDVLNASVELYGFIGTVDLQAAAQYLSVHGNGPRLKQWKPGAALPVLDCSGERINFL